MKKNEQWTEIFWLKVDGKNISELPSVGAWRDIASLSMSHFFQKVIQKWKQLTQTYAGGMKQVMLKVYEYPDMSIDEHFLAPSKYQKGTRLKIKSFFLLYSLTSEESPIKALI